MKARWATWRSKVTGFLRFYGAKVLRAGAKMGAAVRNALSVHRRRTYVQRLWFGIAAAGIAAWAVVALDLAPRLLQPPLPAPEELVQERPLPALPAGLPAEEPPPASDGGDDTPVVEAPSAGKGPEPSAEERPEPAVAGGVIGAYPPVVSQVPAIPVASVDSMVWPAAGEVTKPFGWHRHPVFNDWRYSPGVAIQPLGEDRTVRAALAGRVKDVVNEGGAWRLTVEHAGGWLTEYEGLAEVYVDSLAVVTTGQPLGVAGTALPGGIFFAVRQGGEAVDPVALVKEPVPVASSTGKGELF